MASIALKGYSQILEPKWETCLGGTEMDEGRGIIYSDGSYWIVAGTNSSDGDVSNNHGTYDIWFLNIDSTGMLISEKTFGGSNADGGFLDIKNMNDSIFYITGITKSIDGDIGDNPWPGASGNIWILQINDKGEILWESVHGGSNIEWMRDMEVTNDGGMIALSLTTSDDGDISNHNGAWDLWMIKLDSSGEMQWEMSMGGAGSEEGASITQTEDSGYLITGNTDGYGGGNFDTTCNYHGYPGDWSDVWVIKLDSLRNIEWQQCYGGTFHDGSTNALEIEDGYVILGSTMSNDGDIIGFHGVPGNGEYGKDIWVFKIDKQGNLLWQNCLGGLYNDFARNIFSTTDGGFMVVGRTQSDNGDVEGFNGLEAGDWDDVWLAKLDSLGNLTWQYCYGGGGTEWIYRGVVQKSDYNYVITLGTDTDEWQCTGEFAAMPDLRVVELYDTTVGITENKTQNLSVEVFPNPASERINFTYSLPAGNTSGKLSIFNSSGKLIRIFNLMAMQGQVVYNTSTLPNGVYFYTVVAEGEKETGKFVVVR